MFYSRQMYGCHDRLTGVVLIFIIFAAKGSYLHSCNDIAQTDKCCLIITKVPAEPS